MRTDVVHIGIIDVFVFLAIFQTIYASSFMIKNGRKYGKGNIYQGLLFLSCAFTGFETFMHNTGYITHAWWLMCSSQPINFFIGPFFYLYVFYTLYPDKKPKKIGCHFILPIFWSFYIFFYLLQPDEIKYNGYVEMKHPDWERLFLTSDIPEDPLHLKAYCYELSILSFISYFVASFLALLRRTKELHQSLFHTKMLRIISIRNTWFHCVIAASIYIVLKTIFGAHSLEGDLVTVIYTSCLIFMASYKISNSSTCFDQPFSVLDPITVKYQKSSLTDEQKNEILERVKVEMEVNRYYTNNLSSLSGLAKLVNSPSHHVSQVINERMNKNFYELLASYRIEYAQKLIKEDINGSLTLEEIAEKVGYNAKSSFNTAFKKYTSLTPSEYKRQICN